MPHELGAAKDRNLRFIGPGIRGVVPGFREVDRPEERFLVQIGKNQRSPAMQGSSLRVHGISRRQGVVSLLVVVKSQPDLLEVVGALGGGVRQALRYAWPVTEVRPRAR